MTGFCEYETPGNSLESSILGAHHQTMEILSFTVLGNSKNI